MPPNYPYTLIFGAIDPEKRFPRLNLKTEGGVQKVFSRTNYNLFLDDPEEAAHLTLGRFFQHFGEGITRVCLECCIKPDGDLQPCCLFLARAGQEGKDDGPFVGEEYMQDFLRSYLRNNSLKLSYRPALESCQTRTVLLNMTNTPAERRFLEGYLAHAFWSYDVWTDLSNLNEWLSKECSALSGYPLHPRWLGEHLRLKVTYPAIVPQVWLNWIWDPGLGHADSERDHLQENPSCVDFVILASGRKHIVEIDDPGHYAKFESNRWLVSEEEYTHNLRIERRLKWDGWEVHRFSNWEVLKQFNMRYFLAVIGMESHEGVTATGEEPPF